MKETLTLRVRYMGIVEGTLPQFAFTKLLIQPGGKSKIHSQYVPVTDEHLLIRLQSEFETGQEVEIIVETDWSLPGIPQTLCDVHALTSSISADELVAAAG